MIHTYAFPLFMCVRMNVFLFFSFARVVPACLCLQKAQPGRRVHEGYFLDSSECERDYTSLVLAPHAMLDYKPCFYHSCVNSDQNLNYSSQNVGCY